jgi:hypothetical protein
MSEFAEWVGRAVIAVLIMAGVMSMLHFLAHELHDSGWVRSPEFTTGFWSGVALVWVCRITWRSEKAAPDA